MREKVKKESDTNRSISETSKSLVEMLNKIRDNSLRRLNNSELQDRSKKLICEVRNGFSNGDLLVESFALVFEAVFRVLNIKAFDCQLIAGIHLYNNKVIEMQTGEGKTLAAVFAAYLSALSGNGVHILTFNDYLAKRDAEWMGPVFNFLGLSIGYIAESMNTNQRKKAYSCDITYVTAKEAGFDYLRDSLCYDTDEVVHRPLNHAIVDEADSIMIDEAKAPLVIAARVQEEENMFGDIFKIVRKLKPGQHYSTDEYLRNAYLTDEGIRLFETVLNCGNLFEARNINLISDINNALHAQVLLKRDIDYIVKNEKIELVDEFTGRVAENRHWPDKLQTAVEVKEGIDVASKGRIMSNISIQNFLKLYPKISCMTGTAITSSDEFMNFYGIETVSIPLNRPSIRIDYPDLVFPDQDSKLKAVINEIIEVNKTGRPVLIGTYSIKESEHLALMLKKHGIECQVLNAKNDELEANIISNAGAIGTVTVSTNMAGRGTDIRLGGREEQDRDNVIALGGLYVIGTNRYESIRIDNQLRGRAGRQGNPGSTRFFISLEDNIFMRSNVRIKLKKYISSLAVNPKIIKGVLHVQRIIEGQNFEIRKTLCKYSDIIEQQRKIIFNLRREILNGTPEQNFLEESEPDLCKSIRDKLGDHKLEELERNLTLLVIDQCWAEYLEYISCIRDGIHLVIIGGKDPFEEYLREVIEAFGELRENIKKETINVFRSIKVTGTGIDPGRKELKGPSATWTYLVNDNPFEDDLGLMLASSKNSGFSAVAAGFPLISINLIAGLIYQRFFKKNKHVE